MATAPGFYSWLKVWKEVTYGTFPTPGSPVENTDFCWIRLDQNNAFTMRPAPQSFVIRSADGQNRRVQTGSTRYALAGTLNTLLYPDRATFLLDTALNLTGAPLDLGSYSIEFFDTQKTFRFLGVKVKSLKLDSSADNQIVRLNLDLMGQQTVAGATALAAPTAANFASVNPYTHQESTGLVKLKNGILTKYKSITLTVENMLDGTFDENPYVSNIYWCGRNIDWGVNLQYAATTIRADYESVAVQATNVLKWTKGSNSVTFDLKSTNYITSVADDLPLDKASYQAAQVAVYYDRTATTDLAYTVV